MASTVTNLEHVIVPEIFTPYVMQRTAELSNLIRSGLSTPNPMLDQLITGGGATIHMPFWQDLTGSSQVMSTTRAIETKNITPEQEIAVKLIRAGAWATHQLAGAFAGSDPFNAIAQRVAEWWVRDEQKTLISVLNGVFSSPSMAPLLSSNPTLPIDGALILDAKQLLGDNGLKLSTLIMHSYVFTELQKQDLIQYIQPSGQLLLLPTYLGYFVIVDDGLPIDISGAKPVFSTYLFEKGSVARGEGTPVSLVSTSIDTKEELSTQRLFNRRAIVIHPKGTQWIGTIEDPTNATPSNTDLAKPTAWKRVLDVKQMGMIKILHTI